MKRLATIFLITTMILSSNVISFSDDTNLETQKNNIKKYDLVLLGDENENFDNVIESNSVIYIYNDKYVGKDYEKSFNTRASDGNRLNIDVQNTSETVSVKVTIYKAGRNDITKTISPGKSYTFKYSNDTIIGGVWEEFRIRAADADAVGKDISITVNARQFEEK